jgi:hypothetical protein
LRSAAAGITAAALVAGLIWLGRWALEQVHDQPRYQVAIAEIECNVPDGMERRDFLDEVRYQNPQLEHFRVLAADLSEQVSTVFLRHPWVETVERVTVTPPRTVTVQLTFRTPVLAVRWDGELRAVDGTGILLPKNAATHRLPVYGGTPRPPRGPAGTQWGDPDLEYAARMLRAQH